MKIQRLIWAVCLMTSAAGCVSFGIRKSLVLPPDAVLLDVRRAEEHQVRSVKKAVLIPHVEIEARVGDVIPCKSTPVYVFCRSGKRAGIAIETMKKLGYTNLTNLGGVEDVIETVVGADE